MRGLLTQATRLEKPVSRHFSAHAAGALGAADLSETVHVLRRGIRGQGPQRHGRGAQRPLPNCDDIHSQRA